MARNYYYLVASLPDLIMEENKNVPSISKFMGELEDGVVSQDLETLRMLTRPFDNRNLISALESKDEYDDRGSIPHDVLADAHRSPESLPKYMQQFLEAQKEGRQLYPGLTPLDQLTWLFYDEAAASKNWFIRDWFDFDSKLRNVAAGINIRKGHAHIEALATDRERPGAFTIVGQDEVSEAVLRSSAPDFGLSGSYPWVEKVVALSKGGLTEMERGMDALRWDMLNELTIQSYFELELIAAFVQKLLIVDRWTRLSPAIGKEKLDKLLGELMKSFVMPEGF